MLAVVDVHSDVHCVQT